MSRSTRTARPTAGPGDASAPTAGFRSLAEQLRSWTDPRLAALLRERPDLTTPVPHDMAQLASRAATRASLQRALDQLTRLELVVLDALVVAGPTTIERLAALVHARRDRVEAAAVRLVDLALAWESDQGLRALSGVADGLASGPAYGTSGLRPLSAEPVAEAEVARRLAEISPAARALLEHVDAHGGEATPGSARLTVLPEDAQSPAEELIARRLLAPRGDGTLVVPGEVGLALRGGRTTREPADDDPALATSPRDQATVDRVAAGAAFELVRRLELLLDHWSTTPPPALRSGGLAVRDLKATATYLHVDEATAALVVELAAAAGLLTAGGTPDGTAAWLPTDAFDLWSARPVPERWAVVVRAWLDSPRVPALVGSRQGGEATGAAKGQKAAKAWNALAPDLVSTGQVESRAMALAALAEVPDGEVLASGTGLPSLLARVAWLRPRRPRSRAEQVEWAVGEAAVIGMTGVGGLASFARPFLDGDDTQALDLLGALLPQPVDHVLIQADLTAVAPGPLESELARKLQLLADVESRGGATVYRFSAASLRRGLDNGWSAAELHDFVAEVSRTPVPQPLSYLIDDTARTFGTIRVGHAEAFLRADDEAALTELLHHPQVASLGLRRIAPTVLVTSTPLDVLLPRLREVGAAPVVEAADGTVRVARPDLLRARTPREHRRPAVRAAHDSARIAQAITAIRAGDAASAVSGADSAAVSTPADSLAVLRDAVELGTPVLISYVDNDGAQTDRIVEPRRVDGGQLTAHDRRTNHMRTFAVHRITSVRHFAQNP